MRAIPVAEVGHQARITDVDGFVLQAHSEVSLPVDSHDGVGHRILRLEADHAAVEWRHGERITRDETAVDVELEVVVGVDEPGDLDAVLVDDDGLQL